MTLSELYRQEVERFGEKARSLVSTLYEQLLDTKLVTTTQWNEEIAPKLSNTFGHDFLRQSYLSICSNEILRLEGERIVKEEKLPFENSPDIYGNARLEAYKKGFNSALQSQIDYWKAQREIISKE